MTPAEQGWMVGKTCVWMCARVCVRAFVWMCVCACLCVRVCVVRPWASCPAGVARAACRPRRCYGRAQRCPVFPARPLAGGIPFQVALGDTSVPPRRPAALPTAGRRCWPRAVLPLAPHRRRSFAARAVLRALGLRARAGLRAVLRTLALPARGLWAAPLTSPKVLPPSCPPLPSLPPFSLPPLRLAPFCSPVSPLPPALCLFSSLSLSSACLSPSVSSPPARPSLPLLSFLVASPLRLLLALPSLPSSSRSACPPPCPACLSSSVSSASPALFSPPSSCLPQVTFLCAGAGLVRWPFFLRLSVREWGPHLIFRSPACPFFSRVCHLPLSSSRLVPSALFSILAI